MVGILSTESLNLTISDVIENARKHLVIISPFLKINRKMQFDDGGTAQYAKESDTIAISDMGSFRFKKPIVFRIERIGNGIVLGNEEADLFASGRTLDEALEDLRSEIGMTWKEYATEDDSDMDGIARRYRRWLLDNVEKRDRCGRICVTDRTWHRIGSDGRRIPWHLDSHPPYSPRPSLAIPL